MKPIKLNCSVTFTLCGVLLLTQNIKAMQVKYEYDRYGRIDSVISVNLVNETNTFYYSYLPGTDLVNGYTNSIGLKVLKGFERHRDCISSISNTWNGNLVSAFIYRNDSMKRRVSRKNYNASGLQSSNTFTYNARGEIVGSDISGSSFTYAYDSIGNRVSSAGSNITNTYTANSLNQCVSVSDSQSSISRSFDADGNLTHDNVWHYQWDANNRLHTMHALVETNGSFHVQNKYDSLGRKTSKAIFQLNGRGSGYPMDPSQAGEWALYKAHEYVWNDMNMVLEKTTDFRTTNTTVKTYTWGLDLSGTFKNAGGIGGLLMVSVAKGTVVNNYYSVADANGNITDYLDGSGNVVAHYEYSPFGRLMNKTGVMADEFTHRFSSKPYCLVTHLIEYQYRYYDPVLGIFINRDPFEEKGHTGLYRFVNNDPVNFVDILGLYTLSDAEKALAKAGVKRLGSKYIMTGPYSPSIKQEFYTDTQVFDQWLTMEKNNTGWLNEIPKCPSKIKFDKNKKPCDCTKGAWNSIGKANPEHKGASWCMRSQPTKGNHAQQCCYDDQGRLMTALPAAGTPDYVSNDSSMRGHFNHDLRPWWKAEKLKRENDYGSVRPPCKGGGICYE